MAKQGKDRNSPQSPDRLELLERPSRHKNRERIVGCRTPSPRDKRSTNYHGGKRMSRKKAKHERAIRSGNGTDESESRGAQSTESYDLLVTDTPHDNCYESKTKSPKMIRRESKNRNSNPTKEEMEFVQRIQTLGLHGLMKMFDEELASICNTPVDATQFPSFMANLTKNQSRDIPCVEKTRVVLKQTDANEISDYIHANWVRIPFVQQKFIATQTPLEETVDDFWRMIMQENVQLIINLSGPIKVDDTPSESQDPGTQTQATEKINYWPVRESRIKHCSNYIIANKVTITDQREQYTISDLEVIPKGVGDTRCVRVVYFTKKSISRAPSMIRIMKMIAKHNHHQPQRTTPIVIHCTTGTNLTGTLLLTEIILSWIRSSTPRIVDFKEIFQVIRSQRAKAVDKNEDFTYAICVLLSYFSAKYYRNKELRERIASVLKDLPN